jgi:hypothetical protein
MTWSDWPHWKKGGVIGFNLGCIVHLIRWLLFSIIENHWFSYMFKVILIIVEFPLIVVLGIINIFIQFTLPLILELPLLLAWWFLMGSIIGMITKKINKSKNKE